MEQQLDMKNQLPGQMTIYDFLISEMGGVMDDGEDHVRSDEFREPDTPVEGVCGEVRRRR